MADGIVLERAGVPAVSICTDAFVVPARAMADVYGLPGFEFVTIPHPIASLSPPQIEVTVREATADVVRILMGQP
ncbi:MAG: hypothetical protein JO363_21460 [Solirubrobacterales bacterium]|nr:hypothetical protein [Solirubrobacterales bacterium]